MSINQGATDIMLSVEFAGLCLYVIDRQQATQVGVLMPTCLPTPDGRVSTTHEDGDIGARHVPYLLMDLANLDPTVTPGLVADGPRFQVVRRLNREEILFEPAEAPGSIVKLTPDPLPLPDLSHYKSGIRLKGLASRIPPNEIPELSVRTTLRGGTLEATTVDGPSKVTGSPSQKPDWDKDTEAWAGSVTWTRTIPGDSLALRIRGWDTDQETKLTLRPVTRGGSKVINLKIANLCETNPLEWKEFEHTLEKDDIDFKWLYRLFEPTGRGTLLDAFGGRGRKFPYPKLAPRGARTTGNTGCTGGQFGLP
jgi:hypothetical protein